MPKRPAKHRPTPCKLNGRLLAIYVDGGRKIFGNYNDPAAWDKYNAFCNERQNGGSETLPSVSPSSSEICLPSRVSNAPHGSPGSFPLIADLVAEFMDYAAEKKDKSDFCKFRIACDALLRYATLPTAEFDVYLLLQIQNGFVKAGYARTHCNKLVNFCIQIFRWGENRRLVRKGKREELRAIEPVEYGAARETKGREPVDDDAVAQTLPRLLPMYQSIISILQSTGARPIELWRMKVANVDRSDPDIWVYRVRHHKTERFNKKRIIAFDRRDQIALLPYLDKAPGAFVFAPLDEMRERMERGEKIECVKANIDEQLDTRKVCKELKRTIKEANRELPPDKQIPYWTMYQLRHAYLTKMVEQHGKDDAALVGGHSNSKMVEDVYDHSQERRIIKLKRQQEEGGDAATNGLTGVIHNLDSMGLSTSDIAKATGLLVSEVEAILQKKK